ncbi:MAG TPA: DUF5670 family protein [Bacteroidia bacterium]
MKKTRLNKQIKRVIVSSFTVTCVVASILLTSCSIAKRHYTSGYYVSHSSGKSSDTKMQEQTAQKKIVPSLYAVQNINEKNNLDGGSRQNQAQENGAVTASNKQKVNNTKTIQSSKRASNKLILTPVKRSAPLFSAKKTTTSMVSEDGLSLFWVIILILLILWALAFFTGGWGLGGLIYILLVVALVLLILWLLRII